MKDPVVLDTSVLVNFLRIDRMDLIREHPCDFMVTGQVSDEITDNYSDQRKRLLTAIETGVLRQESIEDPRAKELFESLVKTRRFGIGECSAIALAISRGCVLAIDDRQAANQALRIGADLRILPTQELVVSMIREGVLDINKADEIKELWASRHRFAMKIRSFADVLL